MRAASKFSGFVFVLLFSGHSFVLSPALSFWVDLLFAPEVFFGAQKILVEVVLAINTNFVAEVSQLFLKWKGFGCSASLSFWRGWGGGKVRRSTHTGAFICKTCIRTDIQLLVIMHVLCSWSSFDAASRTENLNNLQSKAVPTRLHSFSVFNFTAGNECCSSQLHSTAQLQACQGSITWQSKGAWLAYWRNKSGTPQKSQPRTRCVALGQTSLWEQNQNIPFWCNFNFWSGLSFSSDVLFLFLLMFYNHQALQLCLKLGQFRCWSEGWCSINDVWSRKQPLKSFYPTISFLLLSAFSHLRHCSLKLRTTNGVSWHKRIKTIVIVESPDISNWFFVFVFVFYLLTTDPERQLQRKFLGISCTASLISFTLCHADIRGTDFTWYLKQLSSSTGRWKELWHDAFFFISFPFDCQEFERIKSFFIFDALHRQALWWQKRLWSHATFAKILKKLCSLPWFVFFGKTRKQNFQRTRQESNCDRVHITTQSQ